MSDQSINYPFKGMVFEGGGTAGVAHVGALQVFNEKGILPQIKFFVGSSAGAITAAALACNGQPDDLHDILFNTDFKQFQDDSRGVIRDIYRFITKYGWYQGDRMESWFGEVAKRLTGNPDITFQEVYDRYGNHLTITVTDINMGETIYLNNLNCPNMKIRTAVKRSSLIPFIFKADREKRQSKVLQNGKVITKNIEHYYVDGGLLNNYPIKQLDQILKPDEVIGFRLMSSLELYEMQIPGLNKPMAPTNMINYITLLYNMLRSQALKVHINEKDWERTVKIDVGDITATDFNMTNDDKIFLIEQGRSAATKFLNKIDCSPVISETTL